MSAAPVTPDPPLSKQNADSPIPPVTRTTSPPPPIPPTQPPLRPPPVIDFTIEDVPPLAEAKTLNDALRVVVMTRLLRETQTQEERVEPVLLANRTVCATAPSDRKSTSAGELIAEVIEGDRQKSRLESFSHSKGTLVERFEDRQKALSEKVERLKAEYLVLQEKWDAHCAALDDQSKPNQAEVETAVPTGGRSTRRSAANLGDAVRSDLEMQQIINSLGNDEATDPAQLSVRNLAIIPDMISVERGAVDYTYDDTNLRVWNPIEFYGPHTGIDDWTPEEKEIFLDKYAAFPKQFGIIADYLPHKTAGQCVDYYYLHKKRLIDFRKIISQYAPNKRRRRRTDKRKGNALLTDIRQHDADMHRDSASPALTGSGRAARGKAASTSAMGPPEPREPRRPSARRAQLETTPTSTPTPEPEARPRKRRATQQPSSRSTLVSQEEPEEEPAPVSSHVHIVCPFRLTILSQDPEPPRPAKRAKRTRKVKSAAIITDEPTTPVSDSKPKLPPVAIVQWSDEDKGTPLCLMADSRAHWYRSRYVSRPSRPTR